MAMTKPSSSVFANKNYTSEWLRRIFLELQATPDSVAIASTYLGLLQLSAAFAETAANDAGNDCAIFKKLPRIMRYFDSAAKAGYVPAQFFKGAGLLEGFGGIENRLLGFSLIMAAAHSEFAPGLNYIGGIYARGNLALNIPPNASQAFAMFYSAAKHGDKRGQRNVGSCILNGFGTAQNTILWIRYLAIAAKKDINGVYDRLAANMLSNMRLQSRLSQQRSVAKHTLSKVGLTNMHGIQANNFATIRAVTRQVDSKEDIAKVAGYNSSAVAPQVLSIVPIRQHW